MQNPSEVFSVLLIIGGDIIQKAIAQLSGRRVTLLSFSFGWVAYAFAALMSAFGDGTFMPDPDYPASVIEVNSRNKKINGSWVIGRLIRDLEHEVERSMTSWDEPLENNEEKPKKSGEWDSGLLVSIYEVRPGAGVPKPDILDWSFFFVLPLQLVVAAVPMITHRDWSILTVTSIGVCLAVMTGSMREWRFEKFHCRKKSGNSYVITRGNGHRHVFVLRADEAKSGLYLDDLAGAVAHATTRTRLACITFAVLWIAFLVVAGGLKDHTWYLLAVGALGMIQNVAVAGLPRKTASHGIPLSDVEKIYGRRKRGERRRRVMEVLYEVDNDYPGLGQAIRPEFFQDFSLRPNEIDEWNRRDKDLQAKKAQEKAAKIAKQPAHTTSPPTHSTSPPAHSTSQPTS